MANPFYVQPGNSFGQGLQALAQTVGQTGEVMRQREQQQKQEAYQAQSKAALSKAVQSGDPAQIREVMIQYPEMQKAAEAAFGFTNEQTRRIAADAYRAAISDPGRALEYMDQGIQQVAAAGGNPNNMLQDYAMLKVAPENAIKSMRAGYAALANEQEYKALFGDKPDEMKVGRFRQITLPDGSIATLDTATNAVTPVQGGSAPPVDLSILPEDMRESVSKQPVETQRKIVESFATPAGVTKGQEGEKQREKQQEVVTKTKDLVEELLKNSEGVRAITGFFDELTPNVTPASRNAQAALDELKNLLTVENLGLMSGVLSESDMAVLRAVGASGLAGDQERILGTLEKMRDALGNSGSSIDDLVSKYAD